MTAYVDLVDDWASARFRRGEVGALTVSAYRYNLASFAKTVRVAPKALTRRDVEHWLEVSALAPATARMRLSMLRLFCRWLVEEGVLSKDPTFGVKGPREPRRLPRGLPHQDVDELLEASPDARTKLVMLLMVQEGLRRKEVVGLQVGDIDMAEHVMLVRGKADHERLLPISGETWRALTAYLFEYPAKAGPLIRSLRDGRSPVLASTVGRIVSQMMFVSGTKKAPGDGRSPHALRHTMATDMLRGGAHIRDVQAALGHVTIVSTQRYLPLIVNDLREAMGGRHYRGRRWSQRATAEAVSACAVSPPTTGVGCASAGTRLSHSCGRQVEQQPVCPPGAPSRPSAGPAPSTR